MHVRLKHRPSLSWVILLSMPAVCGSKSFPGSPPSLLRNLQALPSPPVEPWLPSFQGFQCPFQHLVHWAGPGLHVLCWECALRPAPSLLMGLGHVLHGCVLKEQVCVCARIRQVFRYRNASTRLGGGLEQFSLCSRFLTGCKRNTNSHAPADLSFASAPIQRTRLFCPLHVRIHFYSAQSTD